jgi:hypothetical protein
MIRWSSKKFFQELRSYASMNVEQPDSCSPNHEEIPMQMHPTLTALLLTERRADLARAARGAGLLEPANPTHPRAWAAGVSGARGALTRLGAWIARPALTTATTSANTVPCSPTACSS